VCGVTIADGDWPPYVLEHMGGSLYVIDFTHPDFPASWQDIINEVGTEKPPSFCQSGPGTELKKLLAGWPFFITSSPDCSCNRVAGEMDSWGPDECERPDRVDYILAAMRENAEKRGLPFIDAAGRFLIKRAIKNARKEQRLTT
jgi:hypothetical protein